VTADAISYVVSFAGIVRMSTPDVATTAVRERIRIADGFRRLWRDDLLRTVGVQRPSWRSSHNCSRGVLSSSWSTRCTLTAAMIGVLFTAGRHRRIRRRRGFVTGWWTGSDC